MASCWITQRRSIDGRSSPKKSLSIVVSTTATASSSASACCLESHSATENIVLLVEWLKKYDTDSCMTSRWGLNEKHIGKKVKKVGKKLQQATKQTILLNVSDFDAKEIIILSVDCVNYPTTEFRLDPGTEWYDHKSHGPGLKYEYAVCVHHPYCVWIRGPFPAGKYNDMSLFLGMEKKKQLKAEWNHDALTGIFRRERKW